MDEWIDGPIRAEQSRLYREGFIGEAILVGPRSRWGRRAWGGRVQ